jgi:two-component system, sensor histidine kinase and response regulator
MRGPVTMPSHLKVCDLSAALGRVGGNAQVLREMLALFCQDAPRFQQRLKEAIADGDPDGIQDATHSLRGMLAYFSAETALELAVSIEEMQAGFDQGRAQAAAHDLDLEIERLVSAIDSGLPRS